MEEQARALRGGTFWVFRKCDPQGILTWFFVTKMHVSMIMFTWIFLKARWKN